MIEYKTPWGMSRVPLYIQNEYDVLSNEELTARAKKEIAETGDIEHWTLVYITERKLNDEIGIKIVPGVVILHGEI